MLNKIDNISAGSTFSNASKMPGANNNYNINLARRMDFHDSVDFSPYLKYINQINWKLKDFKYVAKEKLYLDFVISNIQFQVNIDLTNFSALEILDYLVVKDLDKKNFKKKISSKILSRIGKLNYNQENLIVSFNNLDLFFQKIVESGLIGDTTLKDKYILDNFVSDYLNGIIKEFDQLNNQVFIFLDKLADIKFGINRKINLDDDDLLKIKQISISNLE